MSKTARCKGTRGQTVFSCVSLVGLDAQGVAFHLDAFRSEAGLLFPVNYYEYSAVLYKGRQHTLRKHPALAVWYYMRKSRYKPQWHQEASRSLHEQVDKATTDAQKDYETYVVADSERRLSHSCAA